MHGSNYGILKSFSIDLHTSLTDRLLGFQTLRLANISKKRTTLEFQIWIISLTNLFSHLGKF